MLHVPFFCRDNQGIQAYKRCLQKMLRRGGKTEFHCAIIVSHFFEAISDSIKSNQPVNIPNFGAFAVKSWTPRHDPEASAYGIPAFFACRKLKRLVRKTCPTTGVALDGINKARCTAARRNDAKNDRRPWSAHKAFRVRITAQAERIGFHMPRRVVTQRH